MYDVFISHAGEDKDALAIPIYHSLRRRGIRVFLDRPELRVGRNAAKDMMQALEKVIVGLFILSPEFASKKWTILELEYLLRRAGLLGSGRDGAENVGHAARPTLIPVFYRLTVAEAKDRLVFKKYPEVCAKHGFMDRIDKGETNMTKVLDAVSTLAGQTGIENKNNATNDESVMMDAKREELIQQICDEVSRVVGDASKEKVVELQRAVGDLVLEDRFRATFYAPANAEEVVLNFKNVSSQDNACRVEAKALGEVLREDKGDGKVRIVAIKGGAGVGKSTILKGIGGHEDVKGRFPDGAYFISLGMDATIRTLISEVLKILRLSGARDLAKELRDEECLDVVLQRFRQWMRGKRCLLLLDDVWEGQGLGGWVASQLAACLSKGSGSVLVLTTRLSSVALKGTVIEVLPKDALSEEAETILLRYAGFTKTEIMENGLSGVTEELLKMCGGLMVCLAATGCGLAELVLHVGSRGEQTWRRYIAMMRGERLLRMEVDEYKDLMTTLSVSLMVLQERKGKHLQLGARMSWESMHRALCVSKKQTVVPPEVLRRLWELRSDSEVWVAAKAFADVGLAYMESTDVGGFEGLRLHDLIHAFAVASARLMGEEAMWHGKLLEGYLQKEGEVRQWWMQKDNGYLSKNIARHLAESGNVEELVELLLTAQWTDFRLEHGGLLALKEDFSYCLSAMEAEPKTVDSNEKCAGLSLVRDAISESWAILAPNEKAEFGFQMFGRLGNTKLPVVRKFLESVSAWQTGPWLKPFNECWPRPGKAGNGAEIPIAVDGVSHVALHSETWRAVIAAANEVLIIDLKTMRIANRCGGYRHSFQRVAFCRNGDEIMSYGADSAVRRWDVDTGQEIGCAFLEGVGVGHGRRGNSTKLYSVAFSQDCRVLVGGSLNGAVDAWDPQTGERLGDTMCGFECKIECVEVSPDCNRIVAGGNDGTLKMWDYPSRKQIWDVPCGDLENVFCVAFSPDGRFVATGSKERFIRFWDAGNGEQVGSPCVGHELHILGVTFSPDGKRIVSCGGDQTLRIWDFEKRVQIGHPLQGHSFGVEAVACSNDGQFAISAGSDDSFRVWDLQHIASSRPDDGTPGSSVYCGAASRDMQLFISGHSRGVDTVASSLQIWGAGSGKAAGPPMHVDEDAVSSVAISPDNRRFVAGMEDGTMRVWDIASRSQLGEALCGHTDVVHSVAYSTDGGLIVSGSDDTTVRVWSAANRTPTDMSMGALQLDEGEERFEASAALAAKHAHNELEDLDEQWLEVRCVVFSPDAKMIVSGLEGGMLCVWDTISGKPVGSPKSHGSGRRVAKVDIFGEELVRSFDDKGEVMCWRLDSDEGLVAEMETEDGNQSERVDGQSSACPLSAQIVCADRLVRLGPHGPVIATLPANVAEKGWHYDSTSGVLVTGLWDGQVLFSRLVR